MIDYYYEFPEGTKLFDQPVRYAVQRGYHPEMEGYQKRLHTEAMMNCSRAWLRNANGSYLVRVPGDMYHHSSASPKEFLWIQMQAKELD
jgi:hypothetical protein